MVGITIAQMVQGVEMLLTDLPEAQEIVERNISQAHPAKGSTLEFRKLDWDVELPPSFQAGSPLLSLVIAADCTYNPDSRYDFYTRILRFHKLLLMTYDQSGTSQDTCSTS
jgi:hypothetical protein